jgi:hypothetical protein
MITAGGGASAGVAGSDPDVGDDGDAAGVGDAGEAVGVLDGAQHGVVGDVLGEVPGRRVLAVEDRGDLIAVGGVVLVEGEDEEAVVRLGPLGVGR